MPIHFLVKNPYKEVPADAATTEFSAKTNILNWIFFALAAIVATVVCFALGIAGFHRVKPDLEMSKVLSYVLIPFIPGNIIKLIIMIPLAKKLYPIVKNYLA